MVTHSIHWQFDGTACIETANAYYCVGAIYSADGALLEASVVNLGTNTGAVPRSVPDWVTELLSTPEAFDEHVQGAERIRKHDVCLLKVSD